jgi:hypothetical protein
MDVALRDDPEPVDFRPSRLFVLAAIFLWLIVALLDIHVSVRPASLTQAKMSTAMCAPKIVSEEEDDECEVFFGAVNALEKKAANALKNRRRTVLSTVHVSADVACQRCALALIKFRAT